MTDKERDDKMELSTEEDRKRMRPTFAIEDEEDEDEFVYEPPVAPSDAHEEELPQVGETDEVAAPEEESDEDIRSLISKKREKKQKKPKDEVPPSNGKKTKIIFGIIILILLLLIFMVGKALLGESGPKGQGVDESFTSAENISVEKAVELTEIASQKAEGMNTISSLPTVTTEEGVEEEQDFVYEDAGLGVKFEYPKEWVELGQFQTKQTADSVKNVIMVGYPAESDILENMRITIEATPTSITAKEYFNETEGRMKEIFPKFQHVTSGEITVSGREAPTRTYLWVPQSELDRTQYHQEWTRLKQYQVYVAGKTKMYLVTFTSDEKIFDKNMSKYQDILKNLQLGE